MAVSVDGKIIHQVGFGYSDVENQVLALPNTVMRIASISKPITMAAAAKLMDQGKLDIDKPVQHYVPHWPRKSVDGEQVAQYLSYSNTVAIQFTKLGVVCTLYSKSYGRENGMRQSLRLCYRKYSQHG